MLLRHIRHLLRLSLHWRHGTSLDFAPRNNAKIYIYDRSTEGKANPQHDQIVAHPIRCNALRGNFFIYI